MNASFSKPRKMKEKEIKLSDPNFDWESIKSFTKADYTALIAQGLKPSHLKVDLGDGEVYNFLSVRPSQSVMRAIGLAGRDQDFDKSNDLLIKNCIKAGDMEALEDGVVYTAILQALSQSMSAVTATFTKA